MQAEGAGAAVPNTAGKATDDPAAYGGQFKEILDEQTFLKENGP